MVLFLATCKTVRVNIHFDYNTMSFENYSNYFEPIIRVPTVLNHEHPFVVVINIVKNKLNNRLKINIIFEMPLIKRITLYYHINSKV